MIFKDLEKSLKRIPFRKEWEIECKKQKVVFRLNSKSKNPNILETFAALKKKAKTYNHRVSKIERLSGKHSVYNITVDDNHTYGIVTNDFHKSLNGIFLCNCGEQQLPFNSVCLLGSLNLPQFLNSDYTDFDLKKVEKYAAYATRFLDNVNDYTSTPLPEYTESARNRRRIGLGIMGWGSALYLMKIPFASDEAEVIKERLMKCFTITVIKTSIELAKEKGMFKDCEPEKHANVYFWKQIGLSKSLRDEIKEHGIRNSALFSIQPTGNTSIFANVVSGGLEPIFMPEYVRTVIVQDCPEELKFLVPKYWEGEFKETDTFKFVNEGSDQILKAVINGTTYKIDKNRGLTKEVECMDYAVRILKERDEWSPKAKWAKTALSLSVEEHVKDMTGWGKWIDSSMSKTVNVPNNYPYDEFVNLYLDAYKTGYLKGITTYRAGTMMNVLSEKTEEKPEKHAASIQKNNAPKRPRKLSCTVEHLTAKGHRYYAAVGLLNNEQPYEIFTGSNHDSDGEIIIPKSVTSGEIVKLSRGEYQLVSEGREYKLLLGHSDANADALTRILSTALRHGADISFLVHQLEKTRGDMSSFAKVLGRGLKKYIKDGAKVSGENCPSCSGNLVRKDGCISCSDCGWTKCS